MDELLRTAEAMGLHVKFANLGRLNGDLWASGLVRINHTKTLARQRVTLAHECGHWALGHDWSREHNRERDEREADTYAARLLITVDAYREAEALVGGHSGALARELGVTPRLIELRRRDFERDARIIATVQAWRDDTWAS